MPLTPTDVHDRQFKLVRQSTGYDMDEVDSFLDEVEFEIGRLTSDLAASQDEVLQLRGSLSQRESELAATKAELNALRERTQTASANQAGAPVERPAAAPAESNFLAAARLLELAQRTADEYVLDANRQAEQIIADAQSRASEALSGLTERQSQIEAQIAAMQQMQNAIRTRMREYLEGQLQELQSLDDAAIQSAPD